MALVFTVPTNGTLFSTTATGPYSTGSITPTASAGILVCTATDNSVESTINTPSWLSGAWTKEVSIKQATTDVFLTIWSGKVSASPSGAVVTITQGGGGAGSLGCNIIVIQVTGQDATDFVLQPEIKSFSAATSATETLAGALAAATSAVLGVFHHNTNETQTPSGGAAIVTGPVNADGGHNSPTRRLSVQTLINASGPTTAASWSTSSAGTMAAMEIKAVSVTTHNGATASTWTLGTTTAGFATLLGAASASTYTFSSTTVGGARPRAANFEGGTNGNTISTANPGSPHAWDGVTIGADAALIYDNAHARGALAAKVSTGATSTTALLRWVASLAPMTDHYGRVYIYFTAFPAATVRLIRWQDSAGTGISGFIQIGTDGIVSGADTSAGAWGGTTGNPIAINQWVRIEYRVIHSVTVGQMEIKLFNTPDSTTPTMTVTSPANLNTLADGSEARFGVTANVANVAAFWLDDIRAGDFAYPGPAQESGETASTYTFGATTAGDVTPGATEHFGATASTWTLGVTTAGTRTRFGVTASAYSFTATTAGFASHFGTTASAYTFGATTAGVRTRFGATASAYSFNVTTAGVRTRSGATASTWTFSATTAGVRARFGATASPYVFSATTDGSVEAGAGEHSGATSSTWTFGVTTAGAATHFGSSASTWTFSATTAGTRTRFGATASTYTFGAVTAGVRTRFGATASTYTFSATTAAKLTAKAATASGYTFGATTNGTAGTAISGATASTWTFGATTSGVRTRYGASASTWTFGATTAVLRTTFGTAALTGVFTATTQSTGTAFGSSALPLLFTVTTVGPELIELDAISTGQIGHGISGRNQDSVLAGQVGLGRNGNGSRSGRGFIANSVGGEIEE